ncbi:MAG: helix-turn-helix transcriptional regulator [Cyanobacteria bacterium J06600_6]
MTIKNSNTKSELDIIYLENSVILQVQRKGQPIESYYGFDNLVAKRVKSAWEWQAEDELIAIASVTVDSLIVMGCDLTTWEISFKSLPRLAQVPELEKPNFEIDADGSYLYWECADLHVDLEDLKAAVDSEFREQLLIQNLEYGKSFGKAIAVVRKAHKLTQSEIDGISDRHLRRIENEGQQPTLDTLRKLSASHRLDLESYLAKVNDALKLSIN